MMTSAQADFDFFQIYAFNFWQATALLKHGLDQVRSFTNPSSMSGAVFFLRSYSHANTPLCYASS